MSDGRTRFMLFGQEARCYLCAGAVYPGPVTAPPSLEATLCRAEPTAAVQLLPRSRVPVCGGCIARFSVTNTTELGVNL